MLEAILTHSKGIDPVVLKKINDYTMLFWGNQGNHNDFTSKKFTPDFTSAELATAAGLALKNGAQLESQVALAKTLQALDKPLFDAKFELMLTDKNPANGQDPLVASSVNYYSGVTLKDLVGFTERYSLNSRLVKRNGRVQEEVYRAGTPDGKVPAGVYARELGNAIKDKAEQALPYAPDAPKKDDQRLQSATTRRANARTGFRPASTGCRTRRIQIFRTDLWRYIRIREK